MKAVALLGIVAPVALFAVSAFAAIPTQNCANCQLTAAEQTLPAVFNERVQLADTFDVLSKAPGAEPSWSGSVFFQPFDPSGFDASFRTPYWNPTTGFINTPTAPWNQGVTAEYGAQLFNAGLIYVGSMSTAPLAPTIL